MVCEKRVSPKHDVNFRWLNILKYSELTSLYVRIAAMSGYRIVMNALHLAMTFDNTPHASKHFRKTKGGGRKGSYPVSICFVYLARKYYTSICLVRAVDVNIFKKNYIPDVRDA